MKEQDIYSYVLEEKNIYESGVGVPIASGWNWSMYNHINYSILMKNSQFPITQTKLGDKPNKNIIMPVLMVDYRSEGFDLKDIELYVDDKDYYHLSLLGRKFHTKWALKNNIDGFIDDVVGNLVDYGLALVKNVNEERPEVVSPLQIAFCDQTDILSGTIALKHQYSVPQLKEMEKKGWYKDEIDFCIVNAKAEKANPQSPGQTVELPSKSIEVFEVHGSFPNSWLKKDGEEYDEDDELNGDGYSKQLHIISYIKGKGQTKTGICLFKGKESNEIFKVIKRENFRDEIFGRACGLGGIEELFEPQVWTNFNMIAMENMLREASKVIQVTTDKGFTKRQNTKNLQGGEILEMEDGKDIKQLNTQPVSFNLFDRAAIEWEQFSRVKGSASDPALGITPVSGTPLGTTQMITAQGEGIHEFRRGRTAAFIGEIYREWVMDYLVKEMNKGDTWLDELDSDELQEVAEKVSVNVSNYRIKEMILKGAMPTPEMQKTMQDMIKEEFKKGGKKRFIEIMKDEFKDLPVKVKINVAGKQKNLSEMTTKLTNVFQAIFSNPQGFMQVMQIPQASKAFSEMLEYSGLSQMDFSNVPPPMPEQGTLSPIQPSNLSAPLTQ